MKDREERLERAAAIGEKLWRLQKMRLSVAEGELHAIRVAEAAAFEAFGRSEPSLVLAYIDDLTTKRFQAEKALLQAQESARDHGRRVKLTQKLQKVAERLS